MVTRNSPTMADICDILLINKYVDTNINFSNFSIIYDDITKLLLKTFYGIDNIENIQKERELTSYGMIKFDKQYKDLYVDNVISLIFKEPLYPAILRKYFKEGSITYNIPEFGDLFSIISKEYTDTIKGSFNVLQSYVNYTYGKVTSNKSIIKIELIDEKLKETLAFGSRSLFEGIIDNESIIYADTDEFYIKADIQDLINNGRLQPHYIKNRLDKRIVDYIDDLKLDIGYKIKAVSIIVNDIKRILVIDKNDKVIINRFKRYRYGKNKQNM